MHLFVGSLLVLAGLACLRYVWAGVPAFEREPPFLALGVLLIGIGAGLGVRARSAHLLARAGLGAGLLAIVVMIARLYLPSGARDRPRAPRVSRARALRAAHARGGARGACARRASMPGRRS